MRKEAAEVMQGPMAKRVTHKERAEHMVTGHGSQDNTPGRRP